MAISTPILDEASSLLASVLVDRVQMYNVGAPVTAGVSVTRPLSPAGEPVAALVQATTLANAVESRTDTVWSVKVSRDTALETGQAIRVLTCQQDPSLVGKTLLLDKVSQNGLALIKKGVASDWVVVNQEGKGGLA